MPGSHRAGDRQPARQRRQVEPVRGGGRGAASTTARSSIRDHGPGIDEAGPPVRLRPLLPRSVRPRSPRLRARPRHRPPGGREPRRRGDGRARERRRHAHPAAPPAGRTATASRLVPAGRGARCFSARASAGAPMAAGCVAGGISQAVTYSTIVKAGSRSGDRPEPGRLRGRADARLLGARTRRARRPSRTAAGSTSRTRPSTVTPPGRAPGTWRFAGSGRAAAYATSPTRTCASLTNRFANVLAGLGVGKGDLVCVLAGRIPELYVAALGTLKNRSVFCPLFSAFGPEPIRTRMEIGGARVLVTTEALYRRKVAGIRASLPDLERVIVVGATEAADLPGTEDYDTVHARRGRRVRDRTRPTPRTSPSSTSRAGRPGLRRAPPTCTRPSSPTGRPGRLALDLHEDDVFWCTADPGLGDRARPTASSLRSPTA